MLVGLAMFELARRQFVKEWGHTQEEIEREIKKREAAA
jgi:branched-chain amino acid transport system permease protein